MKEKFWSLFDQHLGGLEINLFDLWHFLYLFLIIGGTLLVAYLIRNKSEETKRKITSGILIAALTTYAIDFFCMPFSINHISIDKLPFHICTSISIVAGFAHFSKHLSFLRTPATVLCIVAPLMYMTYPGSALGDISPISYTVVQTFTYHGLLFAYGCLSVSTKQIKLDFKNIWKEFALICCVALWASIGNSLYQGIPSEGSHYDWFFLTGSTFPFIPSWLLPMVVIACVFGMVALIYGIKYLCDYIVKKCTLKKGVVTNNDVKIEDKNSTNIEVEEVKKVEKEAKEKKDKE